VIEHHHLFFVGRRSSAGRARERVRTEGPTLRWFPDLGPTEVAYLDFVVSGAETIAHCAKRRDRRDVLRGV